MDKLTRYNLALPADEKSELEQDADRLGYTTKQAIRQAIRLWRLVRSITDNGGQVIAIDKDGNQTRIVPL